MRLQYPTHIHIIKVPCSGRVDLIHLLMAFEQGADGVFVAGCLEGDCHYMHGNLFARKRVGRAKEILGKTGVGRDRVEMYNLSACHGTRWAEICREFDERITKLGPS